MDPSITSISYECFGTKSKLTNLHLTSRCILGASCIYFPVVVLLIPVRTFFSEVGRQLRLIEYVADKSMHFRLGQILLKSRSIWS